MTHIAMARNKVAWGFILILVLLSTTFVVGCGGGDEGVASLGVGRGGHTATLLPDGRILVAGGRGSAYLASTEVYDQSTGTWTSAGSMAKKRWGHTTTLLNDGRLLTVSNSEVELYDPSTDTWTSAETMIYPRDKGHTATLLADGRVLLAGGGALVDDTIRDAAFAEVYDPSTGEWTLTGDMTEARTTHKATLLKDGRVLVMGGRTAEVYDPTTGIWIPTVDFSGVIGDHGVDFTVTTLQDGRVLVLGGQNPPTWGLPTTHNTADLYDPSTDEWSPTGAMSSEHYGHTATVLKDGSVLVVGFQRAETYDPNTGTWTSLGKMSKPRGRGHTATLLEDGRVLIAGGWVIVSTSIGQERSRTGVESVEIYDPAKVYAPDKVW